MNEEGKQVTVEFLLNHLAVEDSNTQHKFLSQLNSNSSVNMIAYDRRQNRGKSNRAKQPNGRNGAQNKTRVQTSSSTTQPSRKPPGMEGKCMRCRKPEHQQGEKCAAKNAKCKECHKIGHFYKVCQSKKRDKEEANLAQATLQAEQDTYYNPQAKQNTCYNDFTGFGLSNSNPHNQPNSPMVNMLRIINHTGTTSGSQGNHLKFPIDVDPRGPYKNHLIVRVDTGADVNCMNEKTFRRLFPKVKLSVCPHEIQNFGNSTADISILPVCQRPYTLPLKHAEWVKKELNILEAAGIIVRSVSPWASPIVVVPKRSVPGEPPKRRMCVDYRALNKLLPPVKKAHSNAKGVLSLVPLPKIDEIYACLKGSKVFSTLDMHSGYHHVEMTEEARPKTAFTLPANLGKWEFLHCPFGLAQAPAYFQRLINEVLAPFNFAFGYLDDILIYSPDVKTHLKHLELVFQRLREVDLKLKMEKMQLS